MKIKIELSEMHGILRMFVQGTAHSTMYLSVKGQRQQLTLLYETDRKVLIHTCKKSICVHFKIKVIFFKCSVF